MKTVPHPSGSRRGRPVTALLATAFGWLLPLLLAGGEPPPGPRETVPLDSGWRFHLGEEAGAKEPGYSDNAVVFRVDPPRGA